MRRGADMPAMLLSALRLYLRGFLLALASRMAYRLDFVVSFSLMIVSELVFPIITLCIYSTGASFPGWSLGEVLLIQALFMLSKGLVLPFFSGIAFQTMSMVGDGTFDLLLLRPRSPLFMTVVKSFDMEDLGKLVGGIGFVAFVLSRLPAPTAGGVFMAALGVLGGMAVLASIALLVAATSFVWIRNYRLFDIAETIQTFALYPSSIFSKSIRAITTGIFPVALIGVFPASALLGRDLEGMGIALAAAALLLAGSTLLYHRLARRYSSAGG